MSLDDMDDRQVFASLLWGEARGESILGVIAVGCIVRNRVKHGGWWGSDYRSVCLHHALVDGVPVYQFSCFNPGDPNRSLIETIDFENPDPVIQQILWVVDGITQEILIDPTHGANSYCTLASHPVWANPEKLTVKIGNHAFYSV